MSRVSCPPSALPPGPVTPCTRWHVPAWQPLPGANMLLIARLHLPSHLPWDFLQEPSQCRCRPVSGPPRHPLSFQTCGRTWLTEPSLSSEPWCPIVVTAPFLHSPRTLPRQVSAPGDTEVQLTSTSTPHCLLVTASWTRDLWGCPPGARGHVLAPQSLITEPAPGTVPPPSPLSNVLLDAEKRLLPHSGLPSTRTVYYWGSQAARLAWWF